ncbi:unnamed protein product [Vitrella brassicaformis CCMP3155]|uniref:Uncharacterized protein n=3 Tax=Vitrella brassicaformis TaxID=1169539 RepID=A0A0G4EGV5_VITBC|nr:unnamed protein product [Vitrella brassicaformis CCMP3155]|eukprot:CEL94599.1 unnamed protein product [Vitrella brassicaformis CCMP3155]
MTDVWCELSRFEDDRLRTLRKKKRRAALTNELPLTDAQLDACRYTGALHSTFLGTKTFSGKGKYTWGDGATYEGGYVDNCIDGEGVYRWPDGSLYQGQFVQGIRDGTGTFTSADGCIRYVGGWLKGQRHGSGVLTYFESAQSSEAAPTAIYDGQWYHGKKQGQGRQVYPSGSIYNGEWRDGLQCGQGAMWWPTNELYKGEWYNGRPHGRGIYIWGDPPQPKPPAEGREEVLSLPNAAGSGVPSPLEPSAAHGPSSALTQQLLNKYDGQWRDGARHGRGTFWYANGAKYDGVWVKDEKHGHGRFTFEDGSVYEGPFEHDRMTQRQPAVPPPGTVLHTGREDNPIKNCTDLSDIRDIETARLGVAETAQDFKKTYNTLLRALSDLRHIYGRYRAVLRGANQDPYAMTQLQFWILARDAQILSPRIPIAALNRLLASGPRSADPLERLTTDTSASSTESATHGPAQPAASSAAVPGPPPAKRPPASRTKSEGGVPPQGAVGSASSGSSGSKSRTSSRGKSKALPPSPLRVAEGEGEENKGDTGGEGVKLESVLKSSDAKKGEVSSTEDRSKPSVTISAEERVESYPMIIMDPDEAYKVIAQRWKPKPGEEPEGATIREVHSEATPILLREFLEALCRLAQALLTTEPTLEKKVQRLMTDHLQKLPIYEGGGLSIFGLSRADGIQSCWSAMQPSIQQLFDLYASSSSSYVAGRRDVTIRVRDCLAVVERLGFLCEPAREECADDLGQNTMSLQPVRDAKQMEEEAGGSHADAKSDAHPLNGTMKSERSSGGGMSDVQSRRHSFFLGEEADNASVASGVSRPVTPEGRDRDFMDGSPGSAQGGKESQAERMERYSRTSFRLTPMEALTILAEVFPPATLTTVTRYGMSAGDSEGISLLDYLATELVYFEFERFFVRLADYKTSEFAEIPLSDRLEFFFSTAFAPSLTKRYTPPELPAPEPPQEEPPKEDAAEPPPPKEESPTGKKDAKDKKGAPPPPPEPPVEAEAPPPPEPEPTKKELWKGFTGVPEEAPFPADVLSPAAAAAAEKGDTEMGGECLVFPAGYEDELDACDAKYAAERARLLMGDGDGEEREAEEADEEEKEDA